MSLFQRLQVTLPDLQEHQFVEHCVRNPPGIWVGSSGANRYRYPFSFLPAAFFLFFPALQKMSFSMYLHTESGSCWPGCHGLPWFSTLPTAETTTTEVVRLVNLPGSGDESVYYIQLFCSVGVSPSLKNVLLIVLPFWCLTFTVQTDVKFDTERLCSLQTPV